jgi:hypothetical protein
LKQHEAASAGLLFRLSYVRMKDLIEDLDNGVAIQLEYNAKQLPEDLALAQDDFLLLTHEENHDY